MFSLQSGITLLLGCAVIWCLGAATGAKGAEPRSGYPVRPASFEQVTLTDRFWLPRLRTQREVLVPFAFKQTEGALNDLRAAVAVIAGTKPADLPGEVPGPHRYRSSDLFKVMEGAAYLLAVERAAELERQMDAIVEVISAAQEPDGYLNATRTLYPTREIGMMGNARYAYVDHSHELYNVGHLYEAAVAYCRATGKRQLLDVAEKSARHVARVFFEGDPNYNGGKPVNQAPGHEEIELALVKLAEATGEPSYLKTAQRLLDIRGVTHKPEGEGVFAATYAQQHLPVAEQREPVGHAVRATYLYAGMADVAAMQQQDRYGEALERIWTNIVDTRMHITGGLGAVHGIEGFGPENFLPNADAFNETCAAVGNVLFNLRMFRLHRDAKYIDVAEAALYNNVLAGVNFGGDRFFYVNPLAADGSRKFNHGHAERAPWFGTACCPTNLARLIPQVPGMIYASDEAGLFVCLFAASRTALELGGVRTEVVQETAYPYDGKIKLTLTPEREARFAVRLRVPTWTSDRLIPGSLYRYADGDAGPGKVRVSINHEPVEYETSRGFAVLEREWKEGDEIELELPMRARASVCREEVEANRGRIALSRGPLVYSAEGIDNDAHAFNYMVTAGAAEDAEERIVKIGGHDVLAVTVDAQALEGGGEGEGEPRPARLTLVPYYAWNNRGAGSMAVWLPDNRETLAANAIEGGDHAE